MSIQIFFHKTNMSLPSPTQKFFVVYPKRLTIEKKKKNSKRSGQTMSMREVKNFTNVYNRNICYAYEMEC